MQTLWWRAPEVLFGSKEYNEAIDVWSFDMIFAEMAAGGARFQEGSPVTAAVYAEALFRQLGTPDEPELTSLPSWPQKVIQHTRQPWQKEVVLRLGAGGVNLLDAMLAWRPAARPTAATVAKHAFTAPERFEPHLRNACFQGHRHPWNILVGTTAAEVLEWLRADAALRPGTDEFAALAVDFSAKRKDAKSEQGRKFIMSGVLGQGGTGSMCGLSLHSPLPLPRFQAWRQAFLNVNAASFAALEASARAALQRLSGDDLGKNGEHFLQLSVAEWFASAGELVFVEPGNEDAGFWSEPEHLDGGASVMHMGVTLYGRRTLVCKQCFGLPDVTVVNVPGTVYVGQLTGPQHQVTHNAASVGDLLEMPGLGRCGVNVMARTALFAHNRARMRNTTPSPQPVFSALTRCFRESFAASAFRLPTLAECQAAHLKG